MEDLQPIIDGHQKDQEEAASLRCDILPEEPGEKESEPCPTCNQLPEPRDDVKIREDEREIENKASKLEAILVKVEANSSILRTREKLSRFRAHSRVSFLNSNISNINRLIGEIEDKEAERGEIIRSLDSIDQDEVSDLRSEIKRVGSKLSDLQSLERRHQKEIDELNSQKSKLMRDMIGDDGNEESHSLSTKVETLEYLGKMWETVLDNYSQEIKRKSRFLPVRPSESSPTTQRGSTPFH